MNDDGEVRASAAGLLGRMHGSDGGTLLRAEDHVTGTDEERGVENLEDGSACVFDSNGLDAGLCGVVMASLGEDKVRGKPSSGKRLLCVVIACAEGVPSEYCRQSLDGSGDSPLEKRRNVCRLTTASPLLSKISSFEPLVGVFAASPGGVVGDDTTAAMLAFVPPPAHLDLRCRHDVLSVSDASLAASC